MNRACGGLLRLQCGAVALQEARAPAAIRSGADGSISRAISIVSTMIEWRVAGTAFQRKVWNALPKIRGRHDHELRRAGGKARHAQSACARSATPMAPIRFSVVVPCHRLIGANGSLVKYGGGLERKRWLPRMKASC